MCGIAGGVGTNPPDRYKLDNQLKVLAHRGPDEKGSLNGKNFSFGICRLSIVEIESGQQPVSDRENQVHVVFNGEIYNYRELAGKYLNQSRLTTPVTEAVVIIELYKLKGLDFVYLLEGMFAIALYDQRNEVFFIFRDRVGKKPLFYTINDEKTLHFASEPKALYCILPTKTFRQDAIIEIMTLGYVPSPYTALNEIKSLPAGCFGKFKNGKLEVSKYWAPNFDEKISIDYKEAKKITIDLIKQSIEKRLISERPVGVFLSGGVDSSLLTALMTSIYGDKVFTFSIGFDEKNYDESFYAQKVANSLGTVHRTKIVYPNPQVILEEISSILDQPFADSSIIPTYELSKFASKEIVVALGGDGGDEVFGGYERYRIAPKIQKISFLLDKLGPIFPLLAKSGLIRNQRLIRLLTELRGRQNLSGTYKSIMSLTKDDELTKLLNLNVLKVNESDQFEINFNRPGAGDPLSSMIRSDFEYYLPGDLLVKSDMSSMAHGLELRSPYLDHKLIEWVNMLPTRYKIKNGTTKLILKDIARDYISNDVLDRKKMGFAIPRADWIRNQLWDMVNDYLTDKTFTNREWFDKKEVIKILDQHKKGLNRDSIIWPMFILELWARKWLD